MFEFNWFALTFVCVVSGICGGLVVYFPLKAQIDMVEKNSEPKRRRYG